MVRQSTVQCSVLPYQGFLELRSVGERFRLRHLQRHLSQSQPPRYNCTVLSVCAWDHAYPVPSRPRYLGLTVPCFFSWPSNATHPHTHTHTQATRQLSILCVLSRRTHPPTIRRGTSCLSQIGEEEVARSDGWGNDISRVRLENDPRRKV